MEEIGKYKPGDTVYAITSPNVRLVVRRYYKRIYYCFFPDYPKRNELAMFENELMQANNTES